MMSSSLGLYKDSSFRFFRKILIHPSCLSFLGTQTIKYLHGSLSPIGKNFLMATVFGIDKCVCRFLISTFIHVCRGFFSFLILYIPGPIFRVIISFSPNQCVCCNIFTAAIKRIRRNPKTFSWGRLSVDKLY